jgi:hypothetical protein
MFGKLAGADRISTYLNSGTPITGAEIEKQLTRNFCIFGTSKNGPIFVAMNALYDFLDESIN